MTSNRPTSLAHARTILRSSIASRLAKGWRTGCLATLVGLGLAAVPQGAHAATALFDFSNGLNWGFTGDQFNYVGGNTNTSLWTYTGSAWTVDGVNDASRSLTSPTLTLSGAPVTITFTHTRTFEAFSDGGAVQYSTDGGGTFTYVPVDAFTSNGYDGFGNAGNFNPLDGNPLFWGNVDGSAVGPLTSAATLSAPAAGSTMQLRFNAGWDDTNLRSNPNWSIASLVVTGVQDLPAAYWTGTTNSSWYGNNWASDQAGTLTPILPAAGTDVIFSADTVTPLSQNTTLDADFEIHSLTINDPAAVTIGGANTLTISGTSGNTGIVVNANAGHLTIDANLNLAGTPNITVNNSTGATINGAISGSNGLIKNGSGTLVLTSTANSYTGATVVAEGFLQIGADDVLPTGTDLVLGTANSSTAGVFDLNGHNQTVNSISLNGGNTGGTNNFILTQGAHSEFTVSSTTTNSVYGGSIAGELTLNKLGAGTSLTLTGLNNTYIGNTVVDGGGLIVTGSISNTDKVIVGNNNGSTSLTISDGGTVTSTTGTIGSSATSTNNLATVTGTGSTWTTAGNLNIGLDGSNNTLNIQLGGQVSANVTFVGVGSDATGNTVNIDGAGSKLTNTHNLIVGFDGSQNSVTLTNGGQMTSIDSFIGFQTDATNNQITVSGAGSLWTNTGRLYIGDAGSHNTLSIESGGQVTVNGGNQDTEIGSTTDASFNTLRVTGTGSEFANNAATLYVGNSGSNNELDVLDGGLVTSKNVRIGGVLGADGNSATVDGAGSVWNISGELRVGSSGNHNELEITNGGVVTVTGNSFVGYTNDANNSILLIDRPGSTLNAQALIIGLDGRNTQVDVIQGGQLNATTITLAQNADSDGTLQIGLDTAPGYVRATEITGGAGSATVIFSHTATGYTFDTLLTGSLTVFGQGTGETILTNSNTYTGGTVIQSGTIRTANDSALGTGVVSLIGGTLAATNSLTVSKLDWSGGQIQLAPNNGDIVHVTTSLSNLISGGQFVIDSNNLAKGTYTLVTFASTDFTLGDLSALAVNPNVTFQYQFVLDPNDIKITITGAQATGSILQNSAPVGIPTFADFIVNGPVTTGGPGESNTVGTLTFTSGSSLLVQQNLTVTQGPVNLVGGSTLTLDGSLTASQLNVLNGGLLNGNGSIIGNLVNGGLVSPGHSPGQIHVTGNYTQTPSGTLRIEIAGRDLRQHDLLSVDGAAQLDGTLQIVRLDGFKLKRNKPVTFLTADGGVSGRFSMVESDFTRDTILEPTVVYHQNSVALEAVQGSFAALPHLTPNQKSVGRALDSAANDRRANSLFEYLDYRKLNKVPGDLDKIAPEELTSVFTLGVSLANVQSGNIQRRNDDIRSGTGGFSAAGLAVNGTGPSYSGNFGSARPIGPISSDDGKDVKATKDVVAPAENRWGAFLSGTGEWVSVGNTDNARGYDLTSGGFTLGLDYKVTPNLAIGLAAGYTGSSADLTDRGRAYVNGGKIGLYATFFDYQRVTEPASTSKDAKEVQAPVSYNRAEGLYADVAVFGGYNSYDFRRSALQGEARGDTDGGELNALFGAGYDFKAGALTFGPTASFNYTYLGTSDFTEHGSLAPLNIHGGKGESLRTAFGFKASYDWKVGSVLIKPEIRAAWQHEFGDAAYALDADFANGAGDSFRVNGPQLGRNSALLGAGFAIQFNERFSTYFYYDGELGRKDYQSTNVTGGVRLAF